MKLRLIDPKSSLRMRVTSNSPTYLATIQVLVNVLGLERVGLVKFWRHVIRHAFKFTQPEREGLQLAIRAESVLDEIAKHN